MASVRPPARTTSVAKTTRAESNVELSRVLNSDTGLKTKFDAKTNTLTIGGKARGIESRDPTNPNATYKERQATSDYLKTEEFGGTIGFDFDHSKMPKFDTTNGYTEKNKWYFAHSISIGTREGQSPEAVAKALAAKVNENRSYKADVTVAANGNASIHVERR